MAGLHLCDLCVAAGGGLASAAPRVGAPGRGSVARPAPAPHQRVVVGLEPLLALHPRLLLQRLALLITVAVCSEMRSITSHVGCWILPTDLFLYPLPARWSSHSLISWSRFFSSASCLFSSALTASSSYLAQVVSVHLQEAGGRLSSPPLQPQPGGLHLLHLAAELVGVLLVPGRLLLLAAALSPALVPTEMEQTL